MTNDIARVYEFQGFVNGLTQAGAGVVRIETVETDLSTATMNTGWLITDSLVVLPRYCLGPPEANYVCTVGRKRLAADVEHLPAGSDYTRPALLRLQEPLEGCALRLHVKQGNEGDQIVLLHYPGGVPELQVSVGQIHTTEGQSRGGDLIVHDATTTGGSGGAPVLSAATLHVLGIHIGKFTDERGERDEKRNQAIGLVDVLDELRTTPCWAEIGTFHKLSTLGSTAGPADQPDQPKLDTDLIATALRWNVNQDELEASFKERLRPLVVAPVERNWSITGSARRRLISAAGSLDALQRLRPTDAEPTDGQNAIDHIIDGPPYDLDTVSIDELPYWLQITEWFADVVPELPSPAQVDRALARRRVRERLKGVAGTKLWGRESELEQLRVWYADPDSGPVVVTGVGGIGKSALLARFALELQPSTVLLWLDFDRPDLAPDVAVSVLESIAEQMAVQVDEFVKPTFDPSAWEAGADALAESFATWTDPSSPPLLVLDGFEIAQHVERYGVIWDVLERVFPNLKMIRVVVSGRAPVANLTLAGRDSTDIPLRGLTDGAVREFLADRDVRDPTVVSTVMNSAKGIPLVLRLAIRLINEGDDIVSLPTTLPHAMIEGYLYRRILNRVVDQRLRDLARDALIVRQLSAEMIPAVFGDRIPADLDSTEAYGQLSRELALVDSFDVTIPESGAGPLRMRPEVRAPLLRLLEIDDIERVRELDRRAAQWYGGQDTEDPGIAAELVYHQLRLGNVDDAGSAWRDGSAQFLLNAEADIPEEFRTAREWLQAKTIGTADPASEIEIWESEAYERIRSLLARGHPHSIRAVLDERPDRGPNSPLISYDAWLRWAIDADLEGAMRILTEAPPATEPAEAQRTILRAFLSIKQQDATATDAVLAKLDHPELLSGDDGPTGQLAVQAARVRMTVDLERERDLLDLLHEADTELLRLVRGLLTAPDLVLPTLSAMFDDAYGFESYAYALIIPRTLDETTSFAAQRTRMQFSGITRTGFGALDDLLHEFVNTYPNDDARVLERFEEAARGLTSSLPESMATGFELALDIFLLARRRWRIVDRSLFLDSMAEALVRRPGTLEMQIALASTLAVFQRPSMQTHAGELNELAARVLRKAPPEVWLRAPGDVSELAERVLRTEGLVFSDGHPQKLEPEGWNSGVNPMYYYLCGPDPLAVLCQRALGFSSSLD
jgi:hypothetical protein